MADQRTAAAVRAMGWEIRVLSIPLKTPVRWAGHSENHINVVLLDVRMTNGARGVAEMAVRPKWHGEDVEGLVHALDQRLLPALKVRNWRDATAFDSVFDAEKHSALARSLTDMARQDVLAQTAGLPLQAFLMETGGWQRQSIPQSAKFSCTITRAAPDAMAQDAIRLQDTTGARAFKVKTGQGLGTDRSAVASIRSVAGAQALLSADSNSAGTPETLGPMSEMLAGHDVRWFEDPCRLFADKRFAPIAASSQLPVLVDNACRSLEAADRFLRLGAAGLSVKIMKTGIAESIAIAHQAEQAGARITVGICASTALSATYSLCLFAGLPGQLKAMPCEETFFVNLAADIFQTPLQFSNGSILLPSAGPLADKIDWRAIDVLTSARIASI